MASHLNSNKELKKSIELATRSKNLTPKIKNWCSHIQIHSEYGGIIGQMGLPTMNFISCNQADGGGGMDLEWVSYSFITESCKGCAFHNEVFHKNFGREALANYNKITELQIAKKHKEEQIINTLKSKLKSKIFDKFKTSKTTEISILRLVNKLSIQKKQKATAENLLEASKLQPVFFNSLALDCLAIYFENSDIGTIITETFVNTAINDSSKITDFSKERILLSLKGGCQLNLLSRIIPSLNVDKNQEEILVQNLVKGYSKRSFFERNDIFENHSPYIIDFISLFSERHTATYLKIFQGCLMDEEPAVRKNSCLIIYQQSIRKNQLINEFIKTMIHSLDIEEDSYEQTDWIIKRTLIKFCYSDIDLVLSEVFEIQPKLSKGGKEEILEFYDELLKNSDLMESYPDVGERVEEQIITMFSRNELADSLHSPLSVLKKRIAAAPNKFTAKFDLFTGFLIKAVQDRLTFDWYKDNLDSNTATFNPLQGRNFYDIFHEDTVLNNKISVLSDILKYIITVDQNRLIPDTLKIIKNLSSSEKNEEQIKYHLIIVLRTSATQIPSVLTILPDLYNWILDMESILVRIQALKLLGRFIAKNLEILPNSIFDLLHLLLDDQDVRIKKYAIDAYSEILTAKPSFVSISTIVFLIAQFGSLYVDIHKSISDLTYTLIKITSEENQKKILEGTITLLRTHFSQKEPDREFCHKLLEQAVFINRKINTKNYRESEKYIIDTYLLPECFLKNYDQRISALELLTKLRRKNQELNKVWLDATLDILNTYRPQRLEVSIGNSFRKNFFEEFYSLNSTDLSENFSAVELYFKNNIEHIDFYGFDFLNFIDSFGYFGLYEQNIKLCGIITQKTKDIPALSYMFKKAEMHKIFAEATVSGDFIILNKYIEQLNPNYFDNFLKIQLVVRAKTLEMFSHFTLGTLSAVINRKTEIQQICSDIITETANTKENAIFVNYKFILNSIFLLIEWCDKLLNGTDDNALKTSTLTNLNLVNFNLFSHLDSLSSETKMLQSMILEAQTSDLSRVNEIIKVFVQLKWPLITKLSAKTYYPKTFKEENPKQDTADIIVISLELYLHDIPWANPQILKAQEIYLIKGRLKLNKIPKNSDLLKILSSTTSSDLFELKLNDINLTDGHEYEIEGSLLFKFAQNSFEDNISIKLVPYLMGTLQEEFTPIIIGYDELNAKVIDKSNTLFKTGFDSMDKKVYDIYTNPLLTRLENENRTNFIILLAAIANFQGYCLQSGVYKNISSVKEEDFRDTLIQHLTANPNIGGSLVKESQVAGGRVEISFRNHIAELKVEKLISDRSKLIQKYSSQAVAYASGNGKSVSIVCVLDLTKKTLPPGPPADNIILKSTKIHGFENEDSDGHFQVFVFIDGNTKNPSSYSR